MKKVYENNRKECIIYMHISICVSARILRLRREIQRIYNYKKVGFEECIRL